jgi:periplasmic protein TonB
MRMLAAAGGGVCVALLLFLLMNALVDNREGFQRDVDAGRVVEFVRIRPEEAVQTRERQLPREPPPPDKPPPPPRLQTDAQQPVARQVLDMELPQLGIGPTGGPAVATGWKSAGPGQDADLIPIVRVEPSYPREAFLRNIEGWVQLRLHINADGTVASAEVIAAEPPRIFNREAVRAVLRWKFRPRVVDGQPVAAIGEQRIEFTITRDPQ